MADADTLEYRKGRNLAVISFLIIVYIGAGASIGTTTTLGGFILDVDRPEILEWAVIALLLFSAYQYWLAKPKPFADFLQLYRKNFGRDAKLRQYVQKWAEDTIDTRQGKENDSLKKASGIRDLKLQQQPPKSARLKPPGREESPKSVPGQFESVTEIYIPVALYARDQAQGSPCGYCEISVSAWLFYKRALFQLVRSISLHETIWRDVFPWVIAIVASAFMLGNAVISAVSQ